MRNAIEILLPHTMSDSVLKKFFYQRKILDMFKIHSRFFCHTNTGANMRNGTASRVGS